MRLKLMIAVALLLLLPVKSSVEESREMYYSQPTFALSLTTGANSQPVSFALVNVLNGKIMKTQLIPIDQFMMQVTGFMYSPANPEKNNLMAEHGIEHCLPQYEDFSKKYMGYDCPVIRELWRVRYLRDPYNANLREDSGWARGYYGPSLEQQKFLMSNYGISHINDYFVGENMFKFLKDIQDTAWVSVYKNL
ncbi:MAG: hypothetical protein ACOZCO_06465 [Bacteroidota bacterium]